MKPPSASVDRPSHPPPSASVFSIFIDSNIDTRIGLPVSYADTVADVKRKIMIEHMLCFPDVGQVSIQAVQVKRKGAFYHLSDTMPVRCAFDGRKGPWFLHVDVISKSSSEHQGDNTEHVVDDNNKQFVGDFQLQLKPSEHLNEDRPLSKNDFYIGDNMNSHENQCKLADQTGYSVPKPMNCQIESLIDMANDQIAAANQNADGSFHSCHLERQEIDKDAQLHALEPIEQEAEFPTVPSPDMFADQVKGKKLEKLAGSEVLENTTSTDVPKEEKSNKRSDVEDLHLDSVIASLSLPEELSGNLHDGNSSLKKKRKKKSRSSKSKPAEVDSSVPLANHVRDFFDSAKEQNNEKEPALEKSDAIGFVPDVMENTNQHSADEDSVPVDTSKKRKLLSDFDNERLPKISELNHLSSMDSMVVETRTIPVNVTLSCPEALSHKLPDADSSLIEHLTDDKRKKKKRRQSSKSQTNFPIPTDNHVKIFPSIGTEQIMEDRATLETIETIGFVPEVKVGNNEGTSVDNLKDVINKLVDTNEKASENVVSLKVENSSKKIATTDFSTGSMVKGEHSNQISSMAGNMVESDAEKVVFANSHNNIIAEYNVAPVVKEAVPFSNTRKKRSRKSLSKDVSDINEPAEFANKEKEALSRDDTAKLELENPSADNDGKSHSMRTRKSKKSDSKNLSKDVSDINEAAELAINRKEAPNQYDTAKLQSENPSAGDDGKSHGKRTRKSEKVDSKKLSKDAPDINEPAGFANNRKEALGEDDTAKLQSENPSADNVGKSCRRRTRQSEKSDSMNFKSDNSKAVLSSENLVKGYHKDKSNQDQQALRDSAFPTKSDDKKSHRKKKKSSDVVHQDNEPPPKDSSNSLVGKDAGSTATGRLSKEPIPLATDDEAAASGRSAKGHDYGKGGALSTTVENLTDQLPKNIASQGTEESVEARKGEKFPGVDNDDISFIAVFRPNSIQDEPGVSAGQVLPAETKPKKQPKSKRKNKLNKQESAHDFAYPSQSEKLDVKKSSTNCDLVNQDSVDPSGKSSSELCQNRKEHNDSFNLTTDSTRDDGTIASDFTPHVGSVKQTIEANRPDTYHQISESQFQNGNHAHDSNEKTFLESATESHVPMEKEENFNLGVHAVQNQSKPSAGTFEEETHAGLAASSDSAEENTPVQAKRYRLAVRKVPRSIGKKSNNHEPETSFLIPSAIFDDVIDESSEDDVIFRNSEATAATSDSSSTDSEGSKTPRNHGKHEGSDGEDIFLSQSSQISTKNMPLDTILKSSSSYKRAKLLASQSQADDSESQPVDFVPATQPESD
ncbi:uncharacterized protein LOC141830453 [Curcuma longa]|uniref:uncharacterized protein LOC141830453 n=1 Tax=Curcuma longa TaxID=136217 RepID=UPI003D9F9088